MGSSRRRERHDAPLRSRPRTRQQRGANEQLFNPEQTAQQLSQQLRSLGLYAVDTLGDGNCLFRALSDQLYGSPSLHLRLRQEICDWLAAHKERYAPFVDDERGIDVHLNCMRRAGTYGGHLELSAFAHCKRRNVKVIQPGLVYVIEWAAAGDISPTADTQPPEDQLPPDPSPPSLSARDQRRQLREKRKENRHKEKVAKAVADAVLSKDDNDQDDGPVYVVYHDWEHFSSVRNLAGPHKGIPHVVESPTQDQQDIDPVVSKADHKPKSRRPEKAQIKPAINRRLLSPDTVSLPRSRSASPSLSSEASASEFSSFTSSSSPNSSCTTASEASKPIPVPRVALRLERSPKRSFDESSAGVSSSSGSAASELYENQGVTRRSRSSLVQGSDYSDDDDIDYVDAEDELVYVPSGADKSRSRDNDMDVDSRPAPTSGVDDIDVIPEFQFQRVKTCSSLAAPPSMVVIPPSPVIGPGSEPPMTEEENKAAGLSQVRTGIVTGSLARGALGPGKIVIPGGRHKKVQKPDEKSDQGKTPNTQEWRTNGSGRLDVRGFRELKI